MRVVMSAADGFGGGGGGRRGLWRPFVATVVCRLDAQERRGSCRTTLVGSSAMYVFGSRVPYRGRCKQTDCHDGSGGDGGDKKSEKSGSG